MLALYLAAAPAVRGQALPTASRFADAQAGVAFSFGTPDYNPQTFRGLSAYADLDLRPHYGAEFDFHHIGTSADGGSSQQSVEMGGRYLRPYHSLVPYARAMYGRGEFRYPYGVTTMSYNLFSGAAGADFNLTGSARIRVDYEYQDWLGFPDGGLHPQLVSFGLAYHFNGRPRYD